MNSRVFGKPWRLWLAAVAVIFTSAPAFLDWNVGAGGNSKRHARTDDVGPAAATILWNTGVSAVIAQQPVTDGNYVVMSRIYDLGNTQGGTDIVCQNLTTGAIAWQRQLPIDFPSTDWRSRVSAVNHGVVYATRSGNTNASYLYALNITNGNQIWRSQNTIDESSTESMAFADNGDPIVGNFTSLTRIRATDGTTAWSVSRSCPTSDGCSAAVSDPRVYIWEASGTGPKITTFDVTSGARLYSSAGIGGGFVQQLGLFVGPDGTVYGPRTQNNPVSDYLVAYTDSGMAFVEKWRFAIGYVPFASHAVGWDGSVYTYRTVNNGMAGNDITLFRLDPNDGHVINMSAPLTGDYPAQPRLAADHLGRIFFTNGGFIRGRLYSFNADLTPRWDSAITNVNLGGPAIGEDGTLVVAGVGTDVRAYRDSITVVPPTSFSLARGILLSGGLAELTISDDMYMVLRPGVVLSSTEAPIQLILNGVSPISTPSALRFRLEGRANQVNIGNTVAFFNFQANAYDLSGSFPVPTTDGVLRGVIPNPAPFYVETGTNNVRVKISFRATGPILSYPWIIRLDQAIWKVNP